MKHISFFIFFLICSFGCRKETSAASEADILRASQFHEFVQQHDWQLSAYYTLEDFPYYDTSKPSKDHIQQVPWNVRQSWFSVSGDVATIHQDPRFTDPVIKDTVFTRGFKVYATGDGVKVDYCNFQYGPLTYTLESFGDSEFVVSAGYRGVKVLSQFNVR